jgi:hypothetical protein
MSFRCEVCKEAQPIGHAPIQVVVETRIKRYQGTEAIGVETVRELDACPPCSEVLVMKQREERLLREQEAARLAAERKAEISAQSPYLEKPGDWRDGYSIAP